MDGFKEYLAENLEEGLKKLYEAFKNTDEGNNLLLVVSRYNGLKRDINSGITTQESANIRRNQIMAAVKSYAESIERWHPNEYRAFVKTFEVNVNIVNVVQQGGETPKEEPMDITDKQLEAIETAVEGKEDLEDQLDRLLTQRRRLRRDYKKQEAENVGGATDELKAARRENARKLLALKNEVTLGKVNSLKGTFEKAHELVKTPETVQLQDLFDWTDEMAPHLPSTTLDQFDTYLNRLQRQERRGRLTQESLAEVAKEARKITQQKFRSFDI